MTETLLVTPSSLSAGIHRALQWAGIAFWRPPSCTIRSGAKFGVLLPYCFGWLAGVEPIGQDAIARADRLRVISRNRTDVDNLPLDLLAAPGIAEGTKACGVAEPALTRC